MSVNTRLAARVVAALVLVGLAATAVALFVVGAHKNGQIASLRDNGAAVSVRVTTCLGQLGGSGSNLAGYTCNGTFTFDGRRYNVVIPGNVERAPGDHVACVVNRADPTLIDTASDVASERVSWRVYIAPTAMAGALLVLSAGLVILRSRRRSRQDGGV